MASKKNICIDYAGRKVFKRLPQSVNPKILVENLLKQNGLKVKHTDKNGYTNFVCTHNTNKKQFILNIYFASYKFDTQRPDFVNINLGANIEDPYQLSLKDNNSCKSQFFLCMFFSFFNQIMGPKQSRKKEIKKTNK